MAAPCGPLLVALISAWREQRDKGRQKADPKDREIATLKDKNERFESELDRSKKVIEIQAKLSAPIETLASTGTCGAPVPAVR